MADYNFNQDKELENNYKQFKIKLDSVFKKVKQTTDLKQAKSQLIEIQLEFKNIKLNRTDREDLYTKLQQEFANLNQKIEMERTSYENECAANFLNLKNKVENAEFMANHPKDYKESFSFLIDVQNEFRGVKLLREQRENLYNRLQNAFATLKDSQNQQSVKVEITEEIPADDIIKKVTDVCREIEFAEDYYESKEDLIEIQNELRQSKINREVKDDLFAKIQDAFAVLNLKREEEIQKTAKESEGILLDLQKKISEISDEIKSNNDYKTLRDKLKLLQLDMRDLNLTKEHRKEISEQIQLCFEEIFELQDKERGYFHKESKENYITLKELINKAYKQAETTHEYKDTREFLKKIQGEFKGIKLKSDEREELYTKLQKAFEILNTRVDEYFHTKKKNWEVRMQYKISEMQTEIENLEDEIEDEKENLLELEDQLDIIITSGKQTIAKEGLMARIASSKISIQKKIEKIDEMDIELEKLEERVNGSIAEDAEDEEI